MRCLIERTAQTIILSAELFGRSTSRSRRCGYGGPLSTCCGCHPRFQRLWRMLGAGTRGLSNYRCQTSATRVQNLDYYKLRRTHLYQTHWWAVPSMNRLAEQTCVLWRATDIGRNSCKATVFGLLPGICCTRRRTVRNFPFYGRYTSSRQTGHSTASNLPLPSVNSI